MSERLDGLWYAQQGRCCYCDGPTYLPGVETREQARRRLKIAPGVGSGKLLNQHEATLDKLAGGMACKFSNCQRGRRSAMLHQQAMRTKVACDAHPVNRLVEDYAPGRLSWRPIVISSLDLK